MLFITGLRDAARVATFSHLDAKLLDDRVQASENMRRLRRGSREGDEEQSTEAEVNYRPGLIFGNDTTGDERAKDLRNATCFLTSTMSDLKRLANMVRSGPGFPRPNIVFRKVHKLRSSQAGWLCAHLCCKVDSLESGFKSTR